MEGDLCGPSPQAHSADRVTFFGTAVPLLLLASLLLSKHLWESYAPAWLNDLTEQRVALLGMVAGTATIAAIIRIIANPGNSFGTAFAGTAGLATFGAGYVQLTNNGTTWQEEMLAVSIGLTLVPAFPSMASRIYTLPGGFIQLARSPVARLVFLGILFVLSVMMAEWAHDGYIATAISIASAIGRAILAVAGGLFALAVVGYFGWLTWKLVLLIVRTIRQLTKRV